MESSFQKRLDLHVPSSPYMGHGHVHTWSETRALFLGKVKESVSEPGDSRYSWGWFL